MVYPRKSRKAGRRISHKSRKAGRRNTRRSFGGFFQKNTSMSDMQAMQNARMQAMQNARMPVMPPMPKMPVMPPMPKMPVMPPMPNTQAMQQNRMPFMQTMMKGLSNILPSRPMA